MILNGSHFMIMSSKLKLLSCVIVRYGYLTMLQQGVASLKTVKHKSIFEVIISNIHDYPVILVYI